MAGGRIKGITVEIGGDTTKLQTALKGVNSEIKNTQAQLKDVEKLLKLDPGNTQLLSQKQKLLGDAIGETKQKLETLKTASDQANTALANGEISQAQFDALQREIIETTEELKRLEEQAKMSGTAVQEIAAKGEKLKEIGNNISGVGEKMLPATAAITGLGAAAVKTAADFDSGMSKVAAISGATGSDLDALRDKAREMGSKTKFSATEAASAMEYMAMAGWKTGDMLGGIEGIMNLAAASGEDLATTSDIVTDALTAFGLSADDSGHFADILAAASSNANTNVSMMGETFKYCAPIAGALGFSAEDTAEAIGLMANAGIKGSQAGTALRTIMNNMAGPIDIAGEKLGQVTIHTTNADGSMRDLSVILSECRSAFSQLSESEQAAAAETLVGKNAMSGFLALMNAGEGDINKLSNAIQNCDGVSAQMAATMQDNLEGQLTILKSQLQELAISFGEMLIPVIRDVVSFIQGFVDTLNSMDEGTRKVVITIALLIAAIGPVLIIVGKVITAVGTIMTIVPKVVAAVSAVKTGLAALHAVMLANPITLVIAAIAALVAAFLYLWNHSESFRQFWINLWEGIKNAVTAAVEGVKKFLESAWGAIKSTTETVFTGVSGFLSNTWNNIKNSSKSAWSAVKDSVTSASESAGQKVQSVWNKTYEMLSPLLQALKHLFEIVWEAIQVLIGRALDDTKKKVTDSWNGIASFLNQLLEGLRNLFQTIWDAITSAITKAMEEIHSITEKVWNAISSFLTGAMNAISTVLSNTWNNIKSNVTSVMEAIHSSVISIWERMKSAVSSSVNSIKNAVKSGFDQVVSFIKGLISQAYTWGRDLILGIVRGIQNSIGSLVSACRGVANTISSYLHFSTPDVGPLSDYETWMPDFMKGLSKGIEKSKGLLEKAMEGVSDTMVLSPVLSGSIPSLADQAYLRKDTGSYPGLSELLAQGNRETGDITIPVYIGQERIEEIVVTAQQRAAYRSGGR